MNLIIGSAVKIQCELEEADVSGSALTLVSLKGSDAVELATGQSLIAGSGDDSNIFSVVWQSVLNTHPVGRYSFIVKVVNTGIENYAKGYFYLDSR